MSRFNTAVSSYNIGNVFVTRLFFGIQNFDDKNHHKKTDRTNKMDDQRFSIYPRLKTIIIKKRLQKILKNHVRKKTFKKIIVFKKSNKIISEKKVI